MPEFANREELESRFARLWGRMARKHMREFRERLGNPPKWENIPREFWWKLEHDAEQESFPILLLLFGSGLALYGWWNNPSADLTAYGWAIDASKRLADYWSNSTRSVLEQKFGIEPEPEINFGDTIGPAVSNRGEVVTNETVEEHRERNRSNPREDLEQAPTAEAEIDPDSLDEILDSAFGANRVTRIASDWTTAARWQAGETAADELFGTSDDDVWHCDFENSNVCDKCAPLHLTTRRTWGILHPDGAPIHSRCACWVEYANAGGIGPVPFNGHG